MSYIAHQPFIRTTFVTFVMCVYPFSREGGINLFGDHRDSILSKESHILQQDIKSSPSLTGQNSNIGISYIRLNLLTNTNCKLKTPGVFLVTVRPKEAADA